MSHPNNACGPGILGSLGLLVAVGSLTACGSLRPQMDVVVITMVPKETEACRYAGFVAVDSVEGIKTAGMDQLRAQAVRLKANTVLVSSYSASRDGKAFVCDPPLRPRP